jgi:two-component system sensor histidine kinase PilS (NtrC family)
VGHGHAEGQGPVRIRVRLTRSQGSGAALDIIDNGIPIPQEQIEDLFEPFYTTSHTGTGLGLYLARELCEANDAELRYVTMESGNCLRIEFRKSEDRVEPA